MLLITKSFLLPALSVPGRPLACEPVHVQFQLLERAIPSSSCSRHLPQALGTDAEQYRALAQSITLQDHQQQDEHLLESLESPTTV